MQEALEHAIYELSSQKIKTFAAGRTDAGVHAAGQVVHFEIDFVIPFEKWSGALNSKLPKDLINIYFARANILHKSSNYDESSKYLLLANNL